MTTLTPAATGTGSNGVAVGDFNRDGRLDAAVVNSATNDVSILLGDGSGGLTVGPTVGTVTSNPVDIAAGDLDQDGILDLVVAFGSAPQVKVLRGLAGGTFDGSITAFTISAVPTRIYLGNFTADADLDLVVVSEAGQRLLLYGGGPVVAFVGTALTDISLTIAPGERPAAAAVLDFNHNGQLDLAVVTVENLSNNAFARVYLGNGGGVLTPGPQTDLGAGAAPKDIVVGDINRDGWPDLVTANSGASTASVLLNTAGASLTPTTSVPVGGVPLRVGLVDLDHDGVLDLAALDDSATPLVSAFQGQKTGPPYFDTAAATAALPPLMTQARGLAIGDFTTDGRADLVTASFSARLAVVVRNESGMPCARSSFGGAPRSYLAADGPVSTATADFNEDGRQDLVVATGNDSFIRILSNFNGDFGNTFSIGALTPAPPRAVAAADMDVDGHMDVVVAQGDGSTGRVRIYRGSGTGTLTAGAFQDAGVNLSALVIGDFNGDGARDVVAASEDTGQLFRFLGNGAGALGVGAAIPVGAGTSPRALVAADFNNDLKLDVAVANFGANNVAVFFGNGDGTFVAGPVVAVGTKPQGIAAADLDGNGRPDLVTADNGSSRVSVLLDNGTGGFLPAAPYIVGTNPTAVALLQLDGEPKPDIAVTTSETMGNQTLTILRNTGSGTFVLPSDHPVRQSPQAITPIDADSDGLVDLAVPCRSADAVVILVNRPPGPPVLSAAPRYLVLDRPRAAVAADLNGDGKLDLAVADSGASKVSLMNGDGLGGLSEYDTSMAAAAAEAIVAGDFNLDGRIDLAVSAPGTSTVELLFGTGGGAFAAQPAVNVGSLPDDLVAGDFDRDGDLDLAVCVQSGPPGQVRILRNNGPGVDLGTFSLGPSVGAGNKPTAIVAADFDRDGDLDLAVANDDSDDVMVLANSGGSFTLGQTLALLGGDTGPVSLAVGDFNGDGTLDLAAAAIDNDRLHVYRNDGTSFNPTPGAFAVPYVVQYVTAADVNLDGKPDLVAVAGGLSVFRGRGGMDFDPPETVVAGHLPAAAVVADFNRDGRPDIAVVNEGSDDVSVLSSTGCQAQHLELSIQPNACQLGAPLFFLDAQVKAFDDGGNLASCATHTVTPSIVPGTGGGGVLSDPVAPDVVAVGLALAGGVASFTGNDALAINAPGRRYRLQFQASGLAPVLSRSFTLGVDATQIAGPTSVCPSSSGVYSLVPDPGYDSYSWSLDGLPHSFTPTATLMNPPIVLDQLHTLAVTARVDACTVTPPNLDVYFGTLASVTLDIQGGSSVCVDCIGGTAKAIETGGGAIAGRQWGYRTVSGVGLPVSILGETGDTYVLKGASFPGPATYYVVVTSTPGCGTPLVSTEWTVMVVDGVPNGEVQHLAASSRGTSASGQNRLLWVNTTGSADEIRIRWNKAPTGTTTCLPPASFTAPYGGEAVINSPSSGAKDNYLHPGLELNTAYCYSVFVRVAAAWSPGRTVKARPFDSTLGPVKWAYATGGTAVAPPTVSALGILALSNDRTVHALTRGSAGGEWPASWMPTPLVGVAHSRSPVVPFNVALGGATVLFANDDAGFVHAIDAGTGLPPWPAQGPGLSMTGAPGGMFIQYGGVRDALFVGTRDGNVNNQMRALKLADGTPLEAYAPGAPPGPIGPINGTPAIDYATKRLYFASWKRLTGDTLFCLEISPSPPDTPVFTYKWSRDLGNITGSPVLRGGRVYVGTDAGTVYSLDADSGLDDHTFTPSPADGPVKGFLFPDRRNDDLIFATNTKVWSISDAADPMTKNWEWAPGGPTPNPSIVLYRPQTNLVYVGAANGELYELDFTSATPSTAPAQKLQILGGGQGQVGAPSLDLGPPPLLIVGSEPGVLYAVEVPFP